MRFVICMILIGLVSCNESTSDKKPQVVKVQKAIDSVKLTDLDGHPISLEQFKGKTIFINFWATWCKPCIREMPSIDSARQLLSTNGVVFLLASDETLEQIKEFIQHYQFDLSVVRLTNMEELGMEGLPTTWIYNPRGEKVFAETGYRKWNDPTNIEMIFKINRQK